MTTLRAARVPDDVWAAARAKSTADGVTVTDVVVASLRAYTGVWEVEPETLPGVLP